MARYNLQGLSVTNTDGGRGCKVRAVRFRGEVQIINQLKALRTMTKYYLEDSPVQLNKGDVFVFAHKPTIKRKVTIKRKFNLVKD